MDTIPVARRGHGSLRQSGCAIWWLLCQWLQACIQDQRLWSQYSGTRWSDRFDLQFLMGLFSYVYYSSLIRESRISVQMIMQMIITQLPIEEQKQLLYNLTSYLADEN